MAPLTRRNALSLLAWPFARLHGQQEGMASRGVKASPRGKPSGLPFHARFTNVAQEAGLRQTVVSGHPTRALCDRSYELRGGLLRL